MATKYHARSISLPSKSHPSTVKVEEELRKMKTWESCSFSSSSVCGALLGLQDLYDSIDELLKMGSTHQILSCPQLKQLVDELLDGSVKLLDVCSLAKDMAFQTQQHVGALYSAVRRRKGDSAIKTTIAAYTCYRKKMKKEAKKLMISMKKMNEKFNSTQMTNLDNHLSSVIGAMRQAYSINSSILESVLLYLTPLTKPKAHGWSLVSKWVHNGAIACESKSGLNEFESVDLALSSAVEEKEVEKLHMAQRRLESLEMTAREIESGLDGVFRRSIKTRASLLNILSQ
ncbi:uncharacterized protein LOC111433572 [Cucurbita moschata]|uniref:Uncharacterized protein LOC111433572 n=1 Tax=Cucurbita moschata TaxID=3662 RepID=A0A6J1EF12_CUCMO|nr:uncharacterized protein LOC111433572 [Cucurbita moschata]